MEHPSKKARVEGNETTFLRPQGDTDAQPSSSAKQYMDLEELRKRLPWDYYQQHGRELTQVEFSALLLKNNIGEEGTQNFLASCCAWVHNKITSAKKNHDSYQQLVIAFNEGKSIEPDTMTTIYKLKDCNVTATTHKAATVASELIEYFKPMEKPLKISVSWGSGFSANIYPMYTPEVVSVFVDMFELLAAANTRKVTEFALKLLGFFVSMYQSFDFYAFEYQYFEVARQLVFQEELGDTTPTYRILDTCKALLAIGKKMNKKN